MLVRCELKLIWVEVKEGDRSHLFQFWDGNFETVEY